MVVSNVVKGFYFRLKDKSTPLNLKLKLIRYAWNNDSIIIANKVPVLLDCIGGFLINKKRNGLSDEDVCAVWECLNSLLHSSKLRKGKERLVLKPSFCQVVILTMNRLATEKIPYRSSILGSCGSLFTSPALSHLFTSNIHNVVCMLSDICTVSIQQLLKTDTLDPDLQELLSILTEVYDRSQRTNPNQKQIYGLFCDKLFLPCVILIFLCKSHADYQGISCLLSAILKNTLLDKDQMKHYDSYLKVACYMESSLHMPKHIEKFFSVLNNLTNHDKIAPADKTKAAILDFLPTFFLSYLQGEMPTSDCCRMMFFAINKQLGISVETSSHCGRLEESHLLVVLDSLLKHAYNFDIYDVGQDKAEDGLWQLYFTMLVKLLLTMEHKGTSWYSCLETLLKLNPEITESHLSSIFSTCWSSLSQLDSPETASIDSFLTTVFNIYHKLRKVPSLIDMMTTSIEDSRNPCCIQFPQQAYTKFQDIIQLLPQTVEIAIWEKLVTIIKEKLTEVINTKDLNTSKTCAETMNLLVHFLHHCVVVGAAVTSQTTQKAQELMIQMRDSVLTVSVTYCIHQPICDHVLLEATLLLTHAWGDLAILLSHFASLNIQQQFNDPLAFRCFSPSKWKKISKHLNQKSFIANLLQLQRIKASQVFPDSLTEKEAIQVCDVDDFLESLLDPESPDEVTDKTVRFSQFFTDNGLSIKTRRQASWLLVTANLPLLLPIINEDQLYTIAEIVLNTLQDDTKQSENQLERFLTQKLLNDSSFQEMKNLHSCLISVIFSKMSNMATKQKKKSEPSAKKQKVSTVDISEIFTKLCDRKVNWCQSQKKAGKRLTNIGEDICSLLESLPLTNQIGQYIQQHSTTYIQVLQRLPLRFLSPNDQIRAIMGLQVLLACNPISELINPQTGIEDCHQLCLSSVQHSMDCLHTLFLSSGNHSIFLYLNPEPFLDYLKTIFTQVKQESAGVCKISLLISIHRLLKGTFFVLVNEQKTFPALLSYILKLCKGLQKAHKKLGQTPQNMETFEKKYSITYLLATLLVEALGKKIHVCIWKKGVKEEAIGFLGQLSRSILDKSMYHSNELLSPHLAAYNSVLNYQDSLPDSDKDLVKELWEKISVCCYDNLLHKKDISLLLLSVQFYFISLNQSHTAQLLSSETKKSLWQTLHQLMCMFLSEQIANNNRGHSDAHSSQNAASLAASFLDDDYSKKTSTLDADDKKDSQLINSLIEQIGLTMGMILLTSETDDQNFYFEKIVNDLTTEKALTDTMRLKSMVDVALSLFEGQKMKDEHQSKFINPQCDILRYSQTIFQQIQWHTDLSKMENVVIPLLRLESKILQKYKNTIPSQVTLQVMLGCQYIRLNELPVSTFCAVFHAVCDVLYSLLLDFPRAVLATLPSFIGVLKRLLVVVCQEGSQDILAKKPEAVQPISDCAQYLTRLISLLSNNKIELNKVASHLIADYLAAIQQTTILPSVKSFLDNGLYILLTLCNHHAIQNLMVELPDSLKQVFRLVYNKYIQNHKYEGNI